MSATWQDVMSALVQKQTFEPQKGMSALPPIADMCGAARDVCFGPKADIVLFDHLVGAAKHRRGHREAECLGRFEIDQQLILRVLDTPGYFAAPMISGRYSKCIVS
jgi:hypothetical protein